MAYGVLFRRHVENMSVPFRKEMSMADILANPEKTLLEWATSFANDGERNEKFEQMMTDAILEVKKQFDAAKNNNSGATPENAQAPQTLEDKFIAALKRKAGEELGKNMGNRFVGHVKYLAKLPTFEEAVDCFNWSRAFWLDLAKVFAQTDGGGNNTAIYAKMIVVALEEAKNSILGTKDAPLKVKKIDSPPVQNRGRDIDPFYAVASLPKPESRGIQAGASGSMRAPLPGGNGFVRPGANVPPVGSQASLSREPVVVGVDESPKIAQVPEVKNGIALTDMESKFVAYLQTCKQNYWNAPMYDEKTALEVVEYMRGKGVELGKTESLKVWQKVVGEYGNDVGSAVLKFYKTLAPADRPDVKKHSRPIGKPPSPASCTTDTGCRALQRKR